MVYLKLEQFVDNVKTKQLPKNSHVHSARLYTNIHIQKCNT